jgi:hypothetical protein
MINYLFYLKFRVNKSLFFFFQTLTSISKTRLGETENGHELEVSTITEKSIKK